MPSQPALRPTIRQFAGGRQLSVQGWLYGVDRPRTTATVPGFSSTVSLELLLPLVRDADPCPDGLAAVSGTCSRRPVPVVREL
ncbi:hypothetical protein GCM10010448_04720 [Streptomyces glomeratus]|uniref:Uncharacterized protein n=1 Tax=Streptomyces glomeratus TaxID=284452 RepID=A0ABN3YEY1_9ACTN